MRPVLVDGGDDANTRGGGDGADAWPAVEATGTSVGGRNAPLVMTVPSDAAFVVHGPDDDEEEAEEEEDHIVGSSDDNIDGRVGVGVGVSVDGDQLRRPSLVAALEAPPSAPPPLNSPQTKPEKPAIMPDMDGSKDKNSAPPVEEGDDDTDDDKAIAVAVAVRSSVRGSRYRGSSLDKALRRFADLLPLRTVDTRSLCVVIFAGLAGSLLLAVGAVWLRERVVRRTGMNAGFLSGSIGSLLMCMYVLLVHRRRQPRGPHQCQRHRRPHHHLRLLLTHLATYELLLALTFLLEPLWTQVLQPGSSPRTSCPAWLAVIREYLAICATTWTACMALDLYRLMTDPFTSPRWNRRRYRVATHSVALLCSLLHAFVRGDEDDLCWFHRGVDEDSTNNNNNNHGNGDHEQRHADRLGFFLVAPVGVAVAANIYVALIALAHFRDGLAAPLSSRKTLLRHGFLTTVSMAGYGLLLTSVFVAYWLFLPTTTTDRTMTANTGSTTHPGHTLGVLLAFLLTYRGSVVMLLWSLATPSVARHPDGSSAQSANANGSENDGEGSDDEDAQRPQMNRALLDELVRYTTRGIALALASGSGSRSDSDCIASGSSPGRDHPSSSTCSTTFTLRAAKSPWNAITFTEFHARSFALLRRHFRELHDDEALKNRAASTSDKTANVNEPPPPRPSVDGDTADQDFLRSLSACTPPRLSEGTSGAFMYYSTDRACIVKSLTPREAQFLHGMLPAYVAHVQAQRQTYVTRFLGSYCITMYGQHVHFAVMENVFAVPPGVAIHQRYDIKGSWVDRNAQKIRRGAETTCRHCQLTFRCGTRAICPNRAGGHEANVVLKDMDLTTKLRFGPESGRALLAQLRVDSAFLCAQGVMDYSLLLGVIEVSYRVDPSHVLTRDGSQFLNPERSGAGGSKRQCLHASEVVIGPGFYYIGLIDMLQTWTLAKRLERVVKTVLLRKDPDGLSAMAPDAYCARFQRKLEEIIHLGRNISTTTATTAGTTTTPQERA